jgi:hypothetical protein
MATANTVAIPRVVAEELLFLLVDYVNDPTTWGATVKRLENALGMTYQQITAREKLPEAEAKVRELRRIIDGH